MQRPSLNRRYQFCESQEREWKTSFNLIFQFSSTCYDRSHYEPKHNSKPPRRRFKIKLVSEISQTPVPAGDGKDMTCKHVALRNKHNSSRIMLLGKKTPFMKRLKPHGKLDKTQPAICQSAFWGNPHSFGDWDSYRAHGNSHCGNSMVSTGLCHSI